MADSYWLAEPAPLLASRPLAGPADVEIVGGGITGLLLRAHARAGGKARAPARGAHDRLRRERAERRLRAARRRDGVRRGPRVARRRAGGRRTGGSPRTTSTGWRSSAATRSGASAASGWRPTTRSGTSSARSSTRFGRTASRPSGATRLPEPLAGRFAGALFHPADAVLQPARLVRRLAAAAADGRRGAPRALAGRRPRRARGGDGRRGDGRLSERAPRRARGADHPDARPDDRHRAGAGAVVPDAALRPARVRLLAPGSRRAHPRRRLPRLRPRVRVHRLGGDDAADPGRARGLRRGLARPPPARDAPLGGSLRARARPDARRRAACPGATASGSPAATPATGTCSASRAATSSPARSAASRTRCSSSSTRRGSSA